MAFKRKALTRKASRKNFKKNSGTHRKNTATPMRGGIRA